MGRLGLTAGALAAAAAVLLGGALSASGRAARPDLVVKSLRGVPDALGRGESFEVRVKVRNAGNRKAGRSVARFYLSPNPQRSGKVTRLGGKLKVKPLRPGDSFKDKVNLTVPPSTPLGSLYLVACADDTRKVRESDENNNCRVSRGTVEIGPARTTDELIDAAVARGEISAEQGLIYKVYGTFKDPRLPNKYKGVPDPLAPPPLDEVIAGWNDLSKSAKATLGPFLIPPYHEGSWWDRRVNDSRAMNAGSFREGQLDPTSDKPWCSIRNAGVLRDWHYVEATSGPAAGKVRIWYQDRYAATDAALAADLMSAMEKKIWPALTSLMGREPLPDGGSSEPCAGGSDAVDIALVDVDPPSTFSQTVSGQSTPAEMEFSRTVPRGYSGLKPLLAHEFMHMIQFSYRFASGDNLTAGNQWLREGTAQWAMDYVTDPSYGIGLGPQQEEHEALKYFFPYPEESLDSTTPNHHDYGSYLFWLWAVRSGGNPAIVRQAWNAIGTQKSLAAAKSAFGSGWNQAWKDFTRTNWNQGPVEDYQRWDGIGDTPKVEASGFLPNNQTTNVAAQISPVAARYFTFAPGTGANFLTYRNLGTPSAEAGVQAIITNKDGTSDIQDWSAKTKEIVTACNIHEITLVLSNSSIAPGATKPFTLQWKASSTAPPRDPMDARDRRRANACVPQPVQGTFNGTAKYTLTYPDGSGETIDLAWNGNVRLEPNGQMNPWFTDYAGELWDRYTVKSGSVTFSGSGSTTPRGCTIDIPSKSYPLSTDQGVIAIQPGPKPHYGIDLAFPSNSYPQATTTCPDDPNPTTGPFPPPRQALYTNDPEQTMARGTYGGSSTSTYQGTNPYVDEKWSVNYGWNLTGG